MTSTLAFYRMATTASLPLIRLILARRARRGKEDAARLGERMGHASAPRPHGGLIWLHGASVGESQSLLALIERLLLHPAQPNILVTTGTVTSAGMMRKRLPEGVIHQYVPVDRQAWVRRFLGHWRPDAALWTESELWPNLVWETRARGVPMALVNASMSADSAARWRRMPGLAAALAGSFETVLAPDRTMAQRFHGLGARKVLVTGTLKFAAAPLPVDPEMLAALSAHFGRRHLWLAASTHHDEEEAAASVQRRLRRVWPDALTIIAPRHASRGDAIAVALRAQGFTLAQRSKYEAVDAATDIYLADTMGELGTFYRLAPIVFVGGSLIPVGGHNLIEPAQFDCALIHGPGIDNHRPAAAVMRAAEAAIEVQDSDDLAAAVHDLMREPARRDAMAAAAAAAAKSRAGVLDTVLDALAPLLDRLPGAGDGPGAAKATQTRARA